MLDHLHTDTADTSKLDAAGLRQFQELRADAIAAVTQRFYATHGSIYAQFGDRGRQACREDLAFHLEFLLPVLEFGIIQPIVDYLRWLATVLTARDVPAEHLPLSLDWLAEFYAAAMPGADGVIVATALDHAKAGFLKPDDTLPAIYGCLPTAWAESTAFEEALLAGDRGGAAAVVERCLEEGHTLVNTELHVIQPALYGIGHKWQDNQVTVAQEHLATAISQAIMTQTLQNVEAPPSNGRLVLLACVEGNNHAVGLQMVADAYQLAGWEVQFLGANVPTGALLQHIEQIQPDLLGLSVSFAHQLRVVRDIMARLTAQGDKRPAVIIGGLAINQFNRLATGLGADAWSPDAGGAVALTSKFAWQPAAE
ncbi:MAG: cobalamin B12-binding domain-containing protein [Thiobacillus sp.]